MRDSKGSENAVIFSVREVPIRNDKVLSPFQDCKPDFYDNSRNSRTLIG